ncbi:MAG: hypothetical protein V7L12_14035 [Nostoc sp.]|nr:hypothetical protein [Nostoc sp. NMS9]
MGNNSIVLVVRNAIAYLIVDIALFSATPLFDKITEQIGKEQVQNHGSS